KDFGGDLKIPLFSVNENNSGEVDMIGIPVLSASPGLNLNATMKNLAGGIANFVAGYFAAYGISTAPEPPLQLKMNFSSSQALSFTQDLQLQLGVPERLGPYTIPSEFQGFTGSVGLDLGSITEQAPAIALSSGGLQGGGVLTASGSDTIAQLSLQ